MQNDLLDMRANWLNSLNVDDQVKVLRCETGVHKESIEKVTRTTKTLIYVGETAFRKADGNGHAKPMMGDSKPRLEPLEPFNLTHLFNK